MRREVAHTRRLCLQKRPFVDLNFGCFMRFVQRVCCLCLFVCVCVTQDQLLFGVALKRVFNAAKSRTGRPHASNGRPSSTASAAARASTSDVANVYLANIRRQILFTLIRLSLRWLGLASEIALLSKSLECRLDLTANDLLCSFHVRLIR